LFAAIVVLGRAMSMLLPRVAEPAVGAGLNWRGLRLPLLVPMIATPLLLRVLPTHFLPVLVADYLAAHFVLYGLITALCLIWQRPSGAQHSTDRRSRTSSSAFAVSVAAVIAFYGVAMVWPIDSFFTSFVPGPGRVVVILAMLAGTLLYFLSDEWLTRGEGSARAAFLVSKIAFLVSIAGAIALDFERLFFLILMVPVIVLFRCGEAKNAQTTTWP
jgi:hypothetical protein